METTKIVDMIMKDHLADASDAVKDVIMNKAAEILTLEKEKVGANMFGHLTGVILKQGTGIRQQLLKRAIGCMSVETDGIGGRILHYFYPPVLS